MKEVKSAQNLLKIVYGTVPIAAGLDKFLNLLVNWPEYVSPSLASILPFDPSLLMMVVGVVEISAGILVFAKTEIGAYVVSAWLLLIALSLVFTGHHLDVAVRDIVMSVGAFVLAGLTKALSYEPVKKES